MRKKTRHRQDFNASKISTLSAIVVKQTDLYNKMKDVASLIINICNEC